MFTITLDDLRRWGVKDGETYCISIDSKDGLLRVYLDGRLVGTQIVTEDGYPVDYFEKGDGQ